MHLNVKQAFKETIAHITGLKEGFPPLGGIKVAHGDSPTQNDIAGFFMYILGLSDSYENTELFDIYNILENDFLRYYSDEENTCFLEDRIQIIESATDNNIRAKAITEIWAPETAMHNDEILPAWKLSSVQANTHPYKPEEILLQLNGLYTLPEDVPDSLPGNIRDEWNRIKDISDDIFYEYDHPVPIFCPDTTHELVACLHELDLEIGFEKEQAVFDDQYKVPVVISVSVTHPRLDHLCVMWLKTILGEKKYKHLNLFILSEKSTTHLKNILGFQPGENSVFSVSGKYANHFNTLKYFQLIMGKTHGIRAGFKLDSDEGIRSRDLYSVTGTTWFNTMCHHYWGGTAEDAWGTHVYIGVNEGEYVNEKDIKAHGYENSLRLPDVIFDGTYVSPDIFFHKGIAHACATSLYNKAGEKLEDFISHPVVKGGGYGIDNYALKKFVPFTLSLVGRAEDQQFYLSGLARGVCGIFTPDLRIAHYKQSLAASESTTEVSRFIGDMFRLVIFKEIVGFLGVKGKINPMPGVFAGDLARVQAFFSILYKSYAYCHRGDIEKGDLLFRRGIDELAHLMQTIDSGKIKQQWDKEQTDFQNLVIAIESCSPDKLAEAVRNLEIN